MALALRNALGPGAPARSPIDAARDILAKDLDMMRFWWTQREAEEADGLLLFHRFTELVASTPSLRAAQRDMTERLVDVAAEAMAARAGVSPDDPEPRIAAHALLGLWEIQWQSLLRNTDGQHTPEQALALVAADVERAAKLIDSGLWAFGVMVQGKGNREQVKAAADAAQSAGRQVATALRQARTLWQQIQDEHTAASTGDRQRDRERHRAQSDASRRAQREQREQWKQVIREQQQHWREARRTMHEQQREQLRQQADEWQTAAEEWKKWGQL
jgi:hypothetical protein